MRSLGAALLSLAATLGPPQLMSAGMSTGTRPYSAGVAITTFVRGTRSVADPGTLVLMVLWRGEPGWYLKDGPHGGRGGGSGNSAYTIFQSGGLALRADLSETPRQVRIQDQPVTLTPADANVILVDGVDSANGPTVVNSLSIDPSMPGGEVHLESVLRRSPDIVAFLKCDQDVQNAMMNAAVKHNCDLVLGR
jgi:hypothetical protein